jgi:hypothetical protein
MPALVLIQKQPNFVGSFLYGKGCVLILTKKWFGSTFWALFSQTHLVTLLMLFTIEFSFAQSYSKSRLLSPNVSKLTQGFSVEVRQR